MPVKNVRSTLPDPEWIQAVETELAELRSLIAQLRLDVIGQRR